MVWALPELASVFGFFKSSIGSRSFMLENKVVFGRPIADLGEESTHESALVLLEFVVSVLV